MKKIFSYTAGIMLVISLFLFLFISVTKNNFSYKKISTTIKENIHRDIKYSKSYYIEMIIGSEASEVYKSYFDNNKIEELYIDYYAKYLLYEHEALEEKPSIEKLQEYIDECNEKYESITKEEANKVASTHFFGNIDTDISNNSVMSRKTEKFIDISFNQKLQDLCAFVVTLSLILVIMLGRDPKEILIIITGVLGINSVAFFILSAMMKNVGLSRIELMLDILKNVSKGYLITAIVLIVLAVISLVGFILLKNKKEKPYVPDVEEQIDKEISGSMTSGSYREKKQFFK